MRRVNGVWVLDCSGSVERKGKQVVWVDPGLATVTKMGLPVCTR
jgi:hypothetical protein